MPSCAIRAAGLHQDHRRRVASLNDNVSVALDLDARRSIEIPFKVRGALERRRFLEFA